MKKTLTITALAAMAGGFLLYANKPMATMPVYLAHAPARAIKKSDVHAPVFGHPMVPGGITDYATLTTNAELYPGIELENAIFTVTAHSGFAYVSYRKNGHTYWTKHPRFIKAGEPIIIAGNLVILQRCGNMLRFDAPSPSETLFDEPYDLYPPDSVPGDFVLSPTMPPPVETTDVTPTTPVEGPTSSPSAPDTPGVAIFVPNMPTMPPPVIVNTPEPSTLALLMTGLLAILIVLPRMGKL